jgi:delta24-sterol reductase
MNKTTNDALPPVSVSTLAAHNLKVSAVVAEVNSKPPNKKISIRKATVSHQIHNNDWKDKCHRVDVSPLKSILGFKQGNDRSGNPCTLAVCEGQVTMQELVEASLKHGLVPYCVPEFPDFTVAGLINGEGIQTSAFRYGLFTHSVTEMEIILGDGTLIPAATHLNEHAELFANIIESYGTLGLVTCATVALRPALPYVRSSYTLFKNLSDFTKVFDSTVRSMEGDFLEGLVLSDSSYLMIHSHFEAEVGNLPLYDPQPFDHGEVGRQYYYQYIDQEVVSSDKAKLKLHQDVIPTESFVFRSCRGMWWMVETIVGCKPLTNQAWFRRLCDKKAHSAMKTTGFRPNGRLSVEELQRSVVNQDMGVKLSRLEEGIAYAQRNLGVYPLWLCPISVKNSLCYSVTQIPLHPSRAKAIGDDFQVDIGIYGEPTVSPFYHRRVVKALQEFVDAPSDWGISYKNPEDIKQEWAPIREKYHATAAFNSLEEKISFRSADLDSANLELPIPNWRLVDAFGWHWKIVLGAALAVILALLLFCGWFVWQTKQLVSGLF